MKVEKVKTEFEPVVITIKSKRELQKLIDVLQHGKFSVADRCNGEWGLIRFNYADKLLNELCIKLSQWWQHDTRTEK